MPYQQLPVTPYNPPDPLGSVARVQALKNQQMQGQLQQQQLSNEQLANQGGQVQLQQQRSALAEHDAAMQAIQSAGSVEKAMPELMKVAPSIALKYQQQLSEMQASDTKGKLAIIDLNIKKTQRVGQLAGMVKDEQTKMQVLQQAASEGVIEPQIAQELAAKPYDPATYQGFQQQALTSVQQLDETRKTLEQQETARHNKAMETKPPAEEQEFANYYKTYRESKGLPQNAKTEMQARNSFYQSKRQMANVGGALGSDAIELAAQYYLKTGTLPSGLSRDTATTKAVMSRAAELGKSPDGPGGDIAANKADYQAKVSVEKYMTSGKGGQQITAYNTALNHLNTLERLAGDLGNSNVLVFNRAAQMWAKQTGNPAPANFEAAKNAMSGEVAAALKASGATDQEITHVSNTFDNAQSPAQLKGAIGTYRELLRGKAANLKKQYETGMQGKPNFGEQSGATVLMRAPNGQTRPVPADQVEHFKSLGASVVSQ